MESKKLQEHLTAEKNKTNDSVTQVKNTSQIGCCSITPAQNTPPLFPFPRGGSELSPTCQYMFWAHTPQTAH